MTDLYKTVAFLHRAQTSLSLSTTDLCFLLALRMSADCAALPSFDEERLIDVFRRVCDLTEPQAENPQKRATHSIQRLRDQRLLSRVDGAGVVRAGEYALTRLGTAIVDFFYADEKLTRESLALLTRTLLSQLAEVTESARNATTEEQWRAQVVEPLRVTIGDLVGGIERRQRGLDAQQGEIRERIGSLLQEDWFRAVGACEQLLDDTAMTLRELNDVLLQDAAHLQALLGEIEQLAADAHAADAETAAQRVMEQVDRVAAWGGERQRAWSEYYQYVQRYLRDVVRLDPERAVSQRLRNQIAGWLDRRFALVVADAPSIRVLRPRTADVDRPQVAQPRAERDQPLEEQAPDAASLPLEVLVGNAVRSGAADLRSVLAAVLPGLSREERFRATGRIFAAVAGGDVPIGAPRDRPWVTVLDHLEIEDWGILSEED